MVIGPGPVPTLPSLSVKSQAREVLFRPNKDTHSNEIESNPIKPNQNQYFNTLKKKKNISYIYIVS